MFQDEEKIDVLGIHYCAIVCGVTFQLLKGNDVPVRGLMSWGFIIMWCYFPTSRGNDAPVRGLMGESWGHCQLQIIFYTCDTGPVCAMCEQLLLCEQYKYLFEQLLFFEH